MRRLFSVATVGLALALAGCGSSNDSSGGSSAGPRANGGRGGSELAVLSGSENKPLEPIIQRFSQQTGIPVKLDYLGSVEMMLQLGEPSFAYDAVWPANSLWVSLGDKQKRVKDLSSIMRSPVVLGVKRPVAQRLGWIGKPVKVEQILEAAESGKLRFSMSSATQSNSGASAYFGYLYAFAGSPDVLSAADLKKPQVREKIRKILGSVDRSAGSSGWLKDLFLQKYDRFDAMVNYEAVIIEANRELAAQGKEPLYAVYPVDGLAIADSPLGYVNRGDAAKEKAFEQLQKYLLSPEVQKEILATGRRVGLVGMDMSGADPAVFNPEWGIHADKVLSPIRFPSADVIRQALDLYQTAFRKPSLTVYCLDYSGSMKGEGETQLEQAMQTLLDQDQARRYLLQGSPEDRTVVLPFSHRVMAEWSAAGNDPGRLETLFAQIRGFAPNGGTDIYTPVIRAFELLKRERRLDDFFPAVILMTDGNSNQGPGMPALRDYLSQSGLSQDVPVHGILFGSASDRQVKEIAELTSGRVFDGRKDLIRAFREAKGYN
jgi:Ca-activated chloride channel family protein